MSDRVDLWWDRLGWDLTEVILCKLPLRSMIRASAVCKAWRAVLLQLKQQHKQPWLFVFLQGHNNRLLGLGVGRTAFAYDPRDDAESWVSFNLPPDCFAGSAGIAFSLDSSRRLSLAPLLLVGDSSWTTSINTKTPPLASSLCNCNPVVGLVGGAVVVVVAGGARLVGGLVDMNEEPLTTEVLEFDDDCCWRREQCAAALPSLSLSEPRSSALVAGGRLFFVCDTSSCTVSAFDLSRRAWTPPRRLRPEPGLVAAFLASGRGGHRLVLTGVVEEDHRTFRVWDVDPSTMTTTRIGDMPPEILASMMPFGSLRCVGEDGLLYVIADDRHRAYPACACELVAGDGQYDMPTSCTWKKLPPLPQPLISRFHKINAFSSSVLHNLPNMYKY
ncbi:hypothetical protein PR202_ga21844 [Eleusine coracana subsp. coracana]|uniref:F-box domain-containing protein n=1 Tax=Eleusine coracana subsp. coracana TaxID=191504 RepID=A0AAV5D044_ELECO|nr:hypothetical protein PR202_ga21844 [Eleusine coracana subsp. coracana]